MLNAISEKFSAMQTDLLCLNDLLRQCQSTVSCNILERIKGFFFPSYVKEKIQSIADKILNDVKNPKTREGSLRLADAFIRCFEGSWNGKTISLLFDRTIASYRSEYQFNHNENRINYEKWQRYGQDSLIYQRHPEFCSFMENSGLLSQIKVTRDTFREIDGEPAVNVNGNWMKWSVFKEEFKVIYSERYRETFIVANDNQVYTYLDNGKGLQLHHPYLSETTPTSLLSRSDYAKVLEKARLFVREGEEQLSAERREELNEKRTYILQLVSSRKNVGKMRVHNLIFNPDHPYLRLIIGEDKSQLNLKKGEVYEIGFGKKHLIAVPLITTEGRFRSPDINEYRTFYERVVTNIAVTPEEAQAFADYVSDYHRSEVNIGNPIGFHYLTQNCSSFVGAGLESANIKIPTKIKLGKLLTEITPLWALKAGEAIKSFALRVFTIIKNPMQYLPEFLKMPIQQTARKIAEKFKSMLEMFTAVVFIPLKIALGEAFGTGGRAFVKNGDTLQYIEPSLNKLRSWFVFSDYSINMPGVVQRWQLEQASTVVYKNPVRLCIVP